MTDQTIAPGEACAVAAAWTAIPEERRAIILAGEAAIANRCDPLDDWIAIAKAFHELQREAMQQSNSKQPKGRRYSDAYALLELPREIANLQKISKSDRKKAIWIYENEERLRCWYETLAENQRDRWTHPQTIKQHYERMTRTPRADNAVDSKRTVKPASTLDLLKTENVRLREELDTANDEIRLLDREKAIAEISWRARMRDLDAANAKIRLLERAKSEMVPITRKTPPAQIFAMLEAEIPGIRTIFAQLAVDRLESTVPRRRKPVLRPAADRAIKLGRGSGSKKRRRPLTVKVEYRQLELRQTGRRHWDDGDAP
jgi:hypothetical protein